MTRNWGRVTDFVEDMYVLRYAGYTTKQDYCDRLNISMHCFEQRLHRARKRGLMPPALRESRRFNPFGDK